MPPVVSILIQLLVIVLFAPLVNGVIKKVKALTQKRRGAPLLQQYRDLHKLLKKATVVSDSASWLFKTVPYVVLSTAIAAALLLPVSNRLLQMAYPGDLILFFGLLALGRFFMMLAGMDTASTFGGMGSSREAMISALIEPAILVTIIGIGLQSRSTATGVVMMHSQQLAIPLVQPVYILGAFAVLIIIIAETARTPVDDPATHLELTMVHEAMLLEYSGRHLALMEFGAAVKQLALMTLWVNVFFPHDQWIALTGFGGLALSILAYVVKIILAAVLIAFIESITVKFRFFSVPNLAAMAFMLAFLGFLQSFILGRT